MAVGWNCLTIMYRIYSGVFCIQIGTLVTTGTLGAGFAPGLIAVAVFAAILIVLVQKKEKAFNAEYRLHA